MIGYETLTGAGSLTYRLKGSTDTYLSRVYRRLPYNPIAGIISPIFDSSLNKLLGNLPNPLANCTYKILTLHGAHAIVTDAKLRLCLADPFSVPSSLPLRLLASGFVKCSSAVFREFCNDLLTYVGQTVGINVKNRLVWSRDSKTGPRRAEIVGIGNEKVAREGGWNAREYCIWRGYNIALTIVLLVALLTWRGSWCDLSTGSCRQLFPVGMRWLHNFGIMHHICVRVVTSLKV